MMTFPQGNLSSSSCRFPIKNQSIDDRDEQDHSLLEISKSKHDDRQDSQDPTQKITRVSFNLETNQTFQIPLAVDDYTEEEMRKSWWSRDEMERTKKSVAKSIRLLEKKMEQAVLNFDVPAGIIDNQVERKNGDCFRGVEGYVSVRVDVRHKRVTDIWRTIVLEQHLAQRRSHRQSFQWITKRLKKRPKRSVGPNLRLARRVSDLTMDCKLEALLRGKKDAEVARRLRMEDIRPTEPCTAST